MTINANLPSVVRLAAALVLWYACVVNADVGNTPPVAYRLVPVVSSALATPTFVTHAGDGTNRLFIVEQAGVIRVLQPGASIPTVFLDFRTLTLAEGERGLLGLAFHPQYASNRRFFVYYTRARDGAVIIAEFRASSNPNVAYTASTSTTLLKIPHLRTNHNGGMLAFGPDGYLYIGVGDGGGANDLQDNAQNVNVLLGKILRIDVNRPDPVSGAPYSSPVDNPYAGGNGRAEIFSIGWRNPWRFSFDRDTGQQWVADVGQGAVEEVDTPIVKGGNYGWRVFEGSRCTGNDPARCNPAGYLLPVFEYPHANGRCSITGGYVYRGAIGTLPWGTYVYGDFCTGEIMTWDGAAQTVLLNSAMNIASFGEDEQGEIYVVDLRGSLSRIAYGATVCTYGIAPGISDIGAGGGTGIVAVTAGTGCVWTAAGKAPWIHAAAAGSGNGEVAYSVDPNPSSAARNGAIAIAGQTFAVTQQGVTPCSYSVNPTRVTLPPYARTKSVTVAAPAGCAWTAASNAAWITIVSGGDGIADGTVSYSVDALPGRLSQRSGTMTVAGKTVTVGQSR